MKKDETGSEEEEKMRSEYDLSPLKGRARGKYYECYVRQAIEAGLEASRAGRVTSVEDVRSRLGLSKKS